MLKLLFELLELLDSLVLGSCDVGLYPMSEGIVRLVSMLLWVGSSGYDDETYLLPRARPSATGMLDEKVTGSHLVRFVGCTTGCVGWIEILGAWERANGLFCVTLRNLPCRLLSDRVVKVWQPAGVAESNLPLRLSETESTRKESQHVSPICHTKLKLELHTYRHAVYVKASLDWV